MEQSEVLRDKEVIEEKLKKEQGRYETLLDMRMNNEIPREVFSRKQQEVEKKIAELEQQMMQYGDVEACHGGGRKRQDGKPAKAHGAVHHAGGRGVFGRGNG